MRLNQLTFPDVYVDESGIYEAYDKINDFILFKLCYRNSNMHTNMTSPISKSYKMAELPIDGPDTFILTDKDSNFILKAVDYIPILTVYSSKTLLNDLFKDYINNGVIDVHIHNHDGIGIRDHIDFPKSMMTFYKLTQILKKNIESERLDKTFTLSQIIGDA